MVLIPLKSKNIEDKQMIHPNAKTGIKNGLA